MADINSTSTTEELLDEIIPEELQETNNVPDKEVEDSTFTGSKSPYKKDPETLMEFFEDLGIDIYSTEHLRINLFKRFGTSGMFDGKDGYEVNRLMDELKTKVESTVQDILNSADSKVVYFIEGELYLGPKSGRTDKKTGSAGSRTDHFVKLGYQQGDHVGFSYNDTKWFVTIIDKNTVRLPNGEIMSPSMFVASKINRDFNNGNTKAPGWSHYGWVSK